jgi:hypothetical protein
MVCASLVLLASLAAAEAPPAGNAAPPRPFRLQAPGTGTQFNTPPPPGQVIPAPSPSSPAFSPVMAPVAPASTLVSGGVVAESSTLAAAPSATVAQTSVVEAPINISSTETAVPVLRVPSDDELHKRTILVMFPTAYAGHYEGGTGPNLNLFMSWFIGTLYNEKGMFIAPIFSLLLGADAKWSFLEDRGFIPGMAVGYLGGLAIPFTGGSVAASGVAKMKQTDVHNGYLAVSKRLGPVAFTIGGMRGIKRAFPRIIPMLRNASYTTKTIPTPESIWTVWGGIDASYREQHLKLEVTTFPEEKESRPWLFQTHLDGFLGFDIAYLRDAIGYEVIGYYQIPFWRWPDKRQLEKEREKLAEKLLQAQ